MAKQCNNNPFQPITKIVRPMGPCGIDRFNLELNYETDDREFLCQILGVVYDVIDTQNLIIEQWACIQDWVQNMLETYTKDQLQKWLDDGTLENMLTKMADSLRYRSVLLHGADSTGKTDSYHAFLDCYNFCKENDYIMFVPVGEYLLNSVLTIDVLNCLFYGTITGDIIYQGSSQRVDHLKLDFNRITNLTLQGLKGCDINGVYCDNLILNADGSQPNITSIAYSSVTISSVKNITLQGVNKGWINQNKININRIETSLTIGDNIGADYEHNNNKFYDCNLEGAVVTLNYAYCNHIEYRGEGRPNFVIKDNANLNIFRRMWFSAWGQPYLITNMPYKIGNNIFTNPYLDGMNLSNILKINYVTYDSTLFKQSNDYLLAVNDWSYIYESGLIQVKDFINFNCLAKADNNILRMEITFYDSNKTQIINKELADNYYNGIIPWSTTINGYSSSTNTNSASFVAINKNSTPIYVKIKLRLGGSITTVPIYSINFSYYSCVNDLI